MDGITAGRDIVVARARGRRGSGVHPHDALGTPIVVTDENGNVIERFEYEPYGLQVSGPIEDGPGYTGHVEDAATGLTYMQQRYYDPQIGMFLSVDPVTAYGNPVAQFNRYRYTNGNPYRYTDPDGRETRIVLERQTYSEQTIISHMTVTSDRTDLSFSGVALEDRNAGLSGNKDPLVEGNYDGFVRTDGSKGFRVELKDTPNFTNVQVHVGNDADDVMGCFAAGTTQMEDFVSGSQNAMNNIQSIVEADGTGDIVVEVRGSNIASPSPEPNQE